MDTVDDKMIIMMQWYHMNSTQTALLLNTSIHVWQMTGLMNNIPSQMCLSFGTIHVPKLKTKFCFKYEKETQFN